MSSSSPVEFTSYADALDFWNSSNDKIKVVYFYKKDCPYCDDFVPHVLEKELKDRADKINREENPAFHKSRLRRWSLRLCSQRNTAINLKVNYPSLRCLQVRCYHHSSTPA